jgi:peptidyl-prolyl cis-trans isomerase B (cyclophilin B)
MAGGNQRRDASRRRLEQQLAIRSQRGEGSGRRLRVAMVAGAIALVAAIFVIVVVFASAGSSTHPPTATTSTSAAPFTERKTTGPCGFATADAGTNPALRDVGLPPDPNPPLQSIVTVDFNTNRGLIEATLDGKNAPCNVLAVSYLIEKKFYDNTACPRVVDSGIFVVQCGSGGKTTAGGPTFTVPDEDLTNADYSTGAIAMANTGQPNSASSQFFFVIKDSNSGLNQSYTVVGHVTRGLDILQQVAAGGNDGSAGSAGGGAPKLSLEFTTVQIVAVTGGPTPGVGPTATLRAVSTN